MVRERRRDLLVDEVGADRGADVAREVVGLDRDAAVEAHARGADLDLGRERAGVADLVEAARGGGDDVRRGVGDDVDGVAAADAPARGGVLGREEERRREDVDVGAVVVRRDLEPAAHGEAAALAARLDAGVDVRGRARVEDALKDGAVVRLVVGGVDGDPLAAIEGLGRLEAVGGTGPSCPRPRSSPCPGCAGWACRPCRSGTTTPSILISTLSMVFGTTTTIDGVSLAGARGDRRPSS